MAEEVLQRTITEAPSYLQPGIEKYLEGATAQAGQALDTSKFAPQVAGLGAIQQQAQQQAATQAGLGTLQFDPTTGAVSGVSGTGVAGYQPFLQAAAGLTSPTAYQQFESPYQQAVTQATLQSFDEQAQAREQAIRDQAVASGAFGGGREGVQLAEYGRKSDMDRALLDFKTTENKDLIQGFELIYSKFSEILKSKGLTQMEVNKGDKFDAESHEAITQIKADKAKNKGKIVDVIEKGYKLGDKILRYPKVVVAN